MTYCELSKLGISAPALSFHFPLDSRAFSTTYRASAQKIVSSSSKLIGQWRQNENKEKKLKFFDRKLQKSAFN